ncbi:protein-tyrosine phosphatase family protein [Rudaeicoccus suwonensis]|uniref:Tyrosine specific protein phosphatases domain-containing protein n=1 Tax=Rudaeicoccus suwonensis TaxID=657409 RepID=A0A561ECI9_9MICO|nr:tyrosine protein phosphatase [Rudaeicoccus suwonensis]TWE13333.1 hypothetical protein BKA23_2162 [Rudaeicoccus suwonensis]
MIPTIFRIPISTPGTLSIISRPRGGDWLADEIHGLKLLGIHVVVSLLTVEEEIELDLRDEKRVVEAAGILFRRLRTPDRGIPDRHRTQDLADQLGAQLAAGSNIAIHCRYSIGRASLFSAAVMVRAGTRAATAWSCIEHARGLSVPDTDEQRQFIDSLGRARRP